MRAAMNDTALLELATKLAWQAAELILSIRARGFATTTTSAATKDHKCVRYG